MSQGFVSGVAFYYVIDKVRLSVPLLLRLCESNACVCVCVC